MTTRAELVAEARTWIGTPFHHQGRIKGIAADCACMPIMGGRFAGAVAPDFDVNSYPRIPDGESLTGWCDQFMVRIPQSEMQPADVVVVAFDEHPQHLGIVGDYRHGGLSIIHAESIRQKRVIETRLMFSRAMRFVAAYRIPGVE